MRPAITVLQLDTAFPRVAGDVASPDSYLHPIEVLRVPNATVGQIVSNRPDKIDIAPFADALKSARGQVIVTSCGFLSYWQDELSQLTDRPFIASSLNALDHLRFDYRPAEILTLTFDAVALSDLHFRGHSVYKNTVVGLDKRSHLRQVVEQNAPQLDTVLAETQLVHHVTNALSLHHRHVLLECTNLPPYKAALTRATGLQVTDILTMIERVQPTTVNPLFL